MPLSIHAHACEWQLSIGVIGGGSSRFPVLLLLLLFQFMLCYVMLYFQELFVSKYLSGVPEN